MISRVFYLSEVNIEHFHAGSKARSDIETICFQMGFTPIQLPAFDFFDRESGFMANVKRHLMIRRAIKKAVVDLRGGDVLFTQYPTQCNMLLLLSTFKELNRRGVRVVQLVHDLEFMRVRTSKAKSAFFKWRLKLAEEAMVRTADIVIVHNDAMKAEVAASFECNDKHLVSLEIFDYLSEIKPASLPSSPQDAPDFRSCVIAGNLERGKAGYVYNLPEYGHFRLFGPNWEGLEVESDSVEYCGTFSAEELPSRLGNGIGLVWDGPSCDSCTSSNGEYLRINNPHKTSLYLAAGMPVIIWDEAALSDFVDKRGVGFSVSSIADALRKVNTMSWGDYREMKERAIAVGNAIRVGDFTKKAINTALELLK